MLYKGFPTNESQVRRLRSWARAVLVPVAIIGAILSYRSLYHAAVPAFGRSYAVGFPLLVDLLILGASLQYVAGAKVGRPMTGWRLTAHAGVLATLVLNALAAKRLGDVPWHVTAPAVWAVLVELTAKQVLGEWRASRTSRVNPNACTLLVTAPFESVRTRLFMLRNGIDDEQEARIAVGVQAAAREALRLAMPDWSARRARRLINRQLRVGSLRPSAILEPLGWGDSDFTVSDRRPEIIVRDVLRGVLRPDWDHQEQPSKSRIDQDECQPGGDDASDSGEGASKGGPLTDNAEGGDACSGDPRVQERRSERSQQGHLAKKPSSSGRSGTRGRLAHAIGIVQQRPDTTGPELRAELAAGGWTVSDRTAARILLVARAAVDLPAPSGPDST